MTSSTSQCLESSSRHGGLHLCLCCSRASGSSSQEDHYTPTYAAHAYIQSTHVFACACSPVAGAEQERKKINPRAPIPSRGDMFRASAAEALAQPPRILLSPHVTFDCDPIGTPDLARSALAIYRGKHLQASSSLVNFRHTHMHPTRLCQKKMTYNTITCSPSRQNS